MTFDRSTAPRAVNTTLQASQSRNRVDTQHLPPSRARLSHKLRSLPISQSPYIEQLRPAEARYPYQTPRGSCELRTQLNAYERIGASSSPIRNHGDTNPICLTFSNLLFSVQRTSTLSLVHAATSAIDSVIGPTPRSYSIVNARHNTHLPFPLLHTHHTAYS